jgi:hypothetical protein
MSDNESINGEPEFHSQSQQGWFVYYVPFENHGHHEALPFLQQHHQYPIRPVPVRHQVAIEAPHLSPLDVFRMTIMAVLDNHDLTNERRLAALQEVVKRNRDRAASPELDCVLVFTSEQFVNKWGYPSAFDSVRFVVDAQ